MSRFICSDQKICVGLAIGVGTVAAVGAAYWYHRSLANKPPKKWRRIGEISDLIAYPIKSCGPIRVNEIDCTNLGMQAGNLRDRVFMVVTTDGKFVTGRQHPTLVQIMPKIVGDIMTLSAPGMMDIDVDIKRLYTVSPIKAHVWGENVDAADAGEEVARWLSRFLLSEDFGLRLVFFPSPDPTRDVREKNKIFSTMIRSDSGALHDATSFMLINESSVAELNTRLEKQVTPLQFRPNFVVKGPNAFDEDNWKWIRIGKSVIFRNVKPCTRCLFTNIDPDTGDRSADGQPLNKLKEYRQMPGLGDTPVLGIHLGLRVAGKVEIGQPVYIGVCKCS